MSVATSVNFKTIFSFSTLNFNFSFYLAPLTVEIEAHPSEYVIGEDLRLHCYSHSDDVTVTWFKNGQPVRYAESTRILNLEDGWLMNLHTCI